MPDTDSDLDIENLPPPAPAQAATTTLRVAPVLSTTDDPTSFNFAAPIATLPTATAYPKPTTDASLREFFEVDRTVKELKVGGWTRIALQFPDELLGLGAARVCEIIQEEVNSFEDEGQRETEEEEVDEKARIKKKVFILADTSYGSCCVDEIAAQHISADVLVHYGRACLSPTTRLPVVYIFTNSPLNHSSVISGFTEIFPKDENKDKKIILMADVMYTSHLSILAEKLKTDHGYTGIWEAKVVHNPGALLPNRTLPEECVVRENDGEEEKQEKARRLREEWGVFHVGTPMASLLLVLASRVGRIHVYPSPPAIESGSNSNIIQTTTSLQTMPLLRRRYALLTHIRSASIIGILVSTLTVKNYLSLISLLQRLIHSKGKKSYMVVVGKVNPEKLANFSEIEGWVGVGCWEQGVVGGALERGDGGREFWRSVVTPWELGVALGGMGEYDEDVDEEEEEEEEEGRRKKKGKRWEWNGEWITDFDTLLAMDPTGDDVGGKEKEKVEELTSTNGNNTGVHKDEDFYNPLSQVPESAPPAFDLRTGRYSSYSSSFSAPPIQSTNRDLQLLSKSSSNSSNSSSALTHLPNHNSNQIAIKGGVFSPAAEFLREKRTWKGLVVGYEEEDLDSTGTGGDGALVEVGRSGVARGYTVGDEIAESHRR